MNEDLRYPIGQFAPPASGDPEELQEWIREIDAFPKELEASVADLNDEQLDTPYRPGGWTVRQLVHHVADSHMNAVVRFRLALTEEAPTIKPYEEAAWAELGDARDAPIAPSLTILRGLHDRWVRLLSSMSEEDWAKTYHHPDYGSTPLNQALAYYAWHSRHHVAHIRSLKDREGW